MVTVAEDAAPLNQYGTTVQVNSVTPTLVTADQPQPQMPNNATEPYFNRNNEQFLSRNPMMMSSCPHCRRETTTRIRTYPSCLTWTSAGIMFLVFWPICWVPLVVDSMKQTDHYCTSCDALVGRVKAFQDCCVETRG